MNDAIVHGRHLFCSLKQEAQIRSAQVGYLAQVLFTANELVAASFWPLLARRLIQLAGRSRGRR